MIHQQLTSLLELQYHPLNEEGTIALIDTSFKFQDGDFIPVYVEYFGNQVRFFDAGETVLHFSDRGMTFSNGRNGKFLKNIADDHGAAVNSNWEIEAWATKENAGQAFEKYLSTMISIVRWEYKQIGVDTDMSLLLDEVSMCLKSAYPDEKQTPSEEYIGVSGHKYKFDFIHGNKAILAITAHHASVSSALKQIVDLNQVSSNARLSTLIVIDDRYDKKSADNQTKILTAVTEVMPMSVLESKARIVKSMH